MLFGEASTQGVTILKDILKEYEDILGQCVNFEKSTVLFNSNVAKEERACLS